MVLFCIVVGMTAPVALLGFLLGALLTSTDMGTDMDAATTKVRVQRGGASLPWSGGGRGPG